MTVNDLIAELQREQLEGYGEHHVLLHLSRNEDLTNSLIPEESAVEGWVDGVADHAMMDENGLLYVVLGADISTMAYRADDQCIELAEPRLKVPYEVRPVSEHEGGHQYCVDRN